MNMLKTAALAVALIGGSLSLASAPASATPVGAGLAAGAVTAGTPVETVQYWGGPGFGVYGPGYRRPYYGGPRPYWGGPRRYGYGPRLVCRVRYTPWGPRRHCWRRW